jgi:hypothetical protein
MGEKNHRKYEPKMGDNARDKYSFCAKKTRIAANMSKKPTIIV